jgi:hypothetical protein
MFFQNYTTFFPLPMGFRKFMFMLETKLLIAYVLIQQFS